MILCAIALCIAGRLWAQDSDKNWIITKTAIVENGYSIVDITYFNGLGLPMQTVGVMASPNTYNTVTPIVYDALLRDDAITYLPFEVSVSDEALIPNDIAISEQMIFYENRYGTDAERSFIEKVYESSPLNRVRKQALPGYIKDNEVVYIEFGYRTNDVDEVRWLAVGVNGELICEGCYDAGTLACTVTTDADGHVMQSFTDGRGQTLLNRAFDGDKAIDTYSVYDDYGRLRWVVTPEGSYLLSDSQTFEKTDDFAKRYCYIYTYDDRGRMVEKQLPGREAEYMVYDTGDRLVMSQDGNLRTLKKWIIYHHDDFGRVSAQYIAVDEVSQTIEQFWTRGFIQNLFNAGTPPQIYSSVDSTQLIHRFVYDDYPSEVQSNGLDFRWIEGLTMIDGTSLRYTEMQGSQTYEKLAVLSNDTISGYHERAYYYDYKGRLIQTVERDPEGGILCTSQHYDFVGNVIAQRESYADVNGTINDQIDRTFTYDDRSRLLSETTQVNGGELAVVDYEYDELGRLAERRLGEGSDAVMEQSEYDIRNWLTAKTGDLFDMALGHSYSGNISSWSWQHKDPTVGDGPQNRYVFTYDALSRLTNTNQYVNGEKTRQNVERCLSYDRNGNLLTMIRYDNNEEQSNMTYVYSGNTLISYRNGAIVDHGDSGFTTTIKVPHRLYIYDPNGNITKDYAHALNLSYNNLNLLEKVTRNDTIVAKYSYLADGIKQSALDSAGRGMAYRGSFTYRKEFSDSTDVLSFESTPFGGGRIIGTNNGADSEVLYFLTDHLGSVRVVAKDKSNILERNDYQSFGSRWQTASMPVSDNRHRFNGKEEQTFVGLPWADYGARMYDPERGRWLTQDPKAEDYFNITQYGFCGNNPIVRIDSDGKEWYSYQEEYVDGEGQVRTRTQYKYVNGGMSDREMQEGGYTYLGVTYDAGDMYYSMSGAEIPYIMDIQTVQSKEPRQKRKSNKLVNGLKSTSGLGGTLATAASLYDKPLTFGPKYIKINEGGTLIRNTNRIYTSTSGIANYIGKNIYWLSIGANALGYATGSQSAWETVGNMSINTAIYSIGMKSPQTALVLGFGLMIFTPVPPVTVGNDGPMLIAPDNTRIVKTLPIH